MTPLSATYADSPWVDWEVLKLRVLYMRSSVPTLEDLKVGRNWSCFYRSGLWGSKMTMQTGSTYTFESVPGDPLRVANPNSISPIFKFRRGSLEGAHFTGKKIFGYDNVRVTPEGRLVAEHRTSNCSFGECIGGTLVGTPSEESPLSFVLGYQICELN